MERFAQEIAQHLSVVLGRPCTPSDLDLPPDPTMGDFAFPCFRLSKERRKAPPAIAKEIAVELTNLPAGIEVESAGPYVNFRIAGDRLAQELLKDLLDPERAYAKLPADSRSTWIIEASSPNVAKHLQIYHLRSTAHGAALHRIAKYRGFRAILINHLGDWGTQYGKLAVAFDMFGSELAGRRPTVSDLVDFYVRFHQEEEKNPALADQAREAFRKLEAGDPEIRKLWEEFRETSIREFQKSYEKLDVHFDEIRGESAYIPDVPPLMEDLRKKGLLVLSEGAWVVPVADLAGKDIPPCILQKQDGATLYATRDYAAAIYRFHRYAFHRMSYIVGAEQKLHFEQLFLVLKKAGHDWVDRCEHIPLGLYRFRGAKMSTRKGNFTTLEAVLAEAKERAHEVIQKREHSIPPEELDAIAEAVSLGAVLFHDLSTDPSKDVEFDLDRVVDFDGETGPYLQYAHTRCLSILRKAQDSGILKELQVPFHSESAKLLQAPQELALLKTLGHFSLHLERTLQYSKASHLSSYLIDVVRAFNIFYRECRVLSDSEDLSRARLGCVQATRTILKTGLSLLGIPTPNRM